MEYFAWLTGPQMMDGLALGETTPGPLIMIVTWVCYLDGVVESILASRGGGGDLLHLPTEFLVHHRRWPLVEATRGELRFTAPLTTITATVVGVVLNLAISFAWHTFWPQGTRHALRRPLRSPVGRHCPGSFRHAVE